METFDKFVSMMKSMMPTKRLEDMMKAFESKDNVGMVVAFLG